MSGVFAIDCDCKYVTVATVDGRRVYMIGRNVEKLFPSLGNFPNQTGAIERRCRFCKRMKRGEKTMKREVGKITLTTENKKEVTGEDKHSC